MHCCSSMSVKCQRPPPPSPLSPFGKGEPKTHRQTERALAQESCFRADCSSFFVLQNAPVRYLKWSSFFVQIAEGLTYFSDLAATGRPKVVALRDAVMAGEVEMAKDAYIKSRNEYEQIEVLAPGFSDIDCSIDCRACAPPPLPPFNPPPPPPLPPPLPPSQPPLTPTFLPHWSHVYLDCTFPKFKLFESDMECPDNLLGQLSVFSRARLYYESYQR